MVSWLASACGGGYLSDRLRRLTPSMWKFARMAAVLCLCLGTPAVLDIIVQTSGWLSGAECCADDCDESGNPCTQQCIHCVCGGHNVTLLSTERSRLATARVPPAEEQQDRAGARSGHLDPPFRPPVS